MSGSPRPPRVWLAVAAISEHGGSELLVGWQWYQRLRARGPVTVLVTKMFDDPEFISERTRSDCRFIDTRPLSAIEFNARTLTYTVRWWRGCRAILKAEARPGDRLIIAVPGVSTFLPVLAGLPLAREHVFYGPIGAGLTERVARRSSLPLKRDVRAIGASLLWRLLAPVLPGSLGLRSPAPFFKAVAGSRFRFQAECPEVEVRELASRGSSVVTRDCVGVLFDGRPRKNICCTIDYPVEYAAREGLSLSLVNVPDDCRPRVRSIAHAIGVSAQLLPRMNCSDVQTWLVTCRVFASLSQSEGVSSTLLVALQAGCELHVLTVGGMVWLESAASARREQPWRDTTVTIFRWDARSPARFQALASDRFAAILNAVLPGAVDAAVPHATGASQQ